MEDRLRSGAGKLFLCKARESSLVPAGFLTVFVVMKLINTKASYYKFSAKSGSAKTLHLSMYTLTSNCLLVRGRSFDKLTSDITTFSQISS